MGRGRDLYPSKRPLLVNIFPGAIPDEEELATLAEGGIGTTKLGATPLDL